MELYGIKLNDEATIRQMESIEKAQKNSDSNVSLLVQIIVIMKSKDETKTNKEIEDIIYDLSSKEINALSEYVQSIGLGDKKK